MDELSPRARALLDAAHGTDDPIPGDALRVRRSVMTRIGTTGLGAAVFSLSLERAKALLGVASPKVVALVLLAVGGSVVYQRTHQRELLQRSVPGLPAVASVVAPVVAALSPHPEVALPAIAELPPSAPEAAPVAPAHRPRPSLKRSARAQTLDPNAGLEAEMRCVRAADAALRGGNINEAQTLLEQHAREFPKGTLSEERDGLRIVASCQSGDADAARAASLFLERSPRSLLAGRVRTACAPHKNGG
jgi:hypothetical protein